MKIRSLKQDSVQKKKQGRLHETTGAKATTPASALTRRRTADSHQIFEQRTLITLQRQYGNRFVQRAIALSRHNATQLEVMPEVTTMPDLAIQAKCASCEDELQLKRKAGEPKNRLLSTLLNKGLEEEDPLIRIGQQMLGKSAFVQHKPSSSSEQAHQSILHAKSHKSTQSVVDSFNQKQGTRERKELIQRTIGDGHDFDAASRFYGNAVLEATFDNERSIRNGDRGTHVRLVQNVLTALGYHLPMHGVDGSFGSETERAIQAFQQDVGLGVDGVVGFRTVEHLDRRDRGLEVAPPARPVIANAPFNLSNAIAQPGAPPSHALGPCDWGLTFPENVRVRMDVFRDGAFWQPVLSEVVGNYSLQHRLLPTQAEVTGPGGNTTAGNYCAQITELNALGHCPGAWYMDTAVLEHERVHATRFRPALIHPTVITPLEAAIEAIRVPVAAAANAAAAEVTVRADPSFALALTDAQKNWLARILILVAGDHAAGGPASVAEQTIVDPMVATICAHARANGWAACPPLCP